MGGPRMGWDRPEASCFFWFWGGILQFFSHYPSSKTGLLFGHFTPCGTNKNPMRLARYGSLGDILVVQHEDSI